MADWLQPVKKEVPRQIARFVVIGGCSAAIDLAVYCLLSARLGVVTSVAKGLSYLAGVVAGFFGNKYWTFRSPRRSLAEPVTYLAMYGVTLFVNVGVNAACLAVLGSQLAWLAFLIATGTTTVLNFIGMRVVTFRAGIAQRRATSAA